MPEDGQYGRDMWHLLTGIIKFVVGGGNTYVNF